MITRKKVRDKLISLLADNEYKFKYYDNNGKIIGAISSNGSITDEAINSLKNGYFNDENYVEAQNVTIVLIETDSGTYYNEIPSEKDLAIATSIDAKPEPFNPGIVTNPEIKYNAAIHGAPSGKGVQPLSFSISSKGDFFGDLNTFCLISAATYELAIDEIRNLKQQLINLGINVI